MRSKDDGKIQAIQDFLEEKYLLDGDTASLTEIGEAVGLSKSMVHYYLSDMAERGLLEFDEEHRPFTKKMCRFRDETIRIPIIGQIACGTPIVAEENIESYLTLSVQILGRGDFFVLRARGESMIEAGINDGDYVIIKRQNHAEEGQIIVALLEDEATLKRYYLDRKNNLIRLHPENASMHDILVESIIIQGIAVKVIHDV